MKWQLLGIGLVGLVAALAAAMLVATGRSRGPETLADEIPITVATCAVPAMTPVDASHVTVKKVARKQAPADCFADPVQVIGQVLTVPLVEGQALTKTCFAPEGSGFHIASTLPEGMRAMSISLIDHSRLDGLLYPGSLVDVLASFKANTKGGDKNDLVSVTLLKTIQVLAVENRTVAMAEDQKDKSASQSGDRRKRVTLMVTARQAEALQLAMEHGELSLVLRDPRDNSQAEEHITRLADLSQELREMLTPEPEAAHETARPESIPAGPLAAAPEVPPQPVASESAPEPAAEPSAKTPAPVVTTWTTTLLRGGASATRTFTRTADSRSTQASQR